MVLQIIHVCEGFSGDTGSLSAFRKSFQCSCSHIQHFRKMLNCIGGGFCRHDDFCHIDFGATFRAGRFFHRPVSIT